MKSSLWRQPYLIELTYAENFRLIRDSIQGQRLKVLDVGCGTGFMSLELARNGHDVLGIDSNDKIISLAKRTMETDPYKKGRGSLHYQTANFSKWEATPESFDVVLFSRVLHDMSQPETVLSKVRNLLKNNGRLICLEFAYDRLDRPAAIWLYQIRKALEALGFYFSPHLPENPKSGVDQIVNETLEGRKEHINRFEEMRHPMTRLFHEEKFDWHPYHFWDIVADMKIPDPQKEKSLAGLLRRMETFLVETGEIQSVLFQFVGIKKL